MSLKNTAKETLEILTAGKYTNKSGTVVEFLAAQQMAVKKTVLYSPQHSAALLAAPAASTADRPPTIAVTAETTQVAAQRLAQTEGCHDLVLLSFASARNPGGGFINGAKAQEEDLARCSGIYPCLLTQPKYYDANREPAFWVVSIESYLPSILRVVIQTPSQHSNNGFDRDFCRHRSRSNYN